MNSVNLKSKSIIFLTICLFQVSIVVSHMSLTHEKVDIESASKDYISDLSFSTGDGPNPGLNMNCELLKDLVGVEVNLTAFSYNMDVYVPTVLTLQTPICEFILDNMIYIMRDVVSDGVHGNFPKECIADHITKGPYFLKDFTVDNVPPFALVGRWKLLLQLIENGETIMAVYWYFKVEKIN